MPEYQGGQHAREGHAHHSIMQACREPQAGSEHRELLVHRTCFPAYRVGTHAVAGVWDQYTARRDSTGWRPFARSRVASVLPPRWTLPVVGPRKGPLLSRGGADADPDRSSGKVGSRGLVFDLDPADRHGTPAPTSCVSVGGVRARYHTQTRADQTNQSFQKFGGDGLHFDEQTVGDGASDDRQGHGNIGRFW